MKLTYSLESVLHTDFSEDITCIGLEFHKFLADLELTAFHEYKDTEDYPEEVFHATMAGLLEQLGEDELELPLLFTVELDKEMSLFGFPFRYTFLLAGREHFHSLSREYEVDKETEELCLSEDTDCIVIYTGMSLQG